PPSRSCAAGLAPMSMDPIRVGAAAVPPTLPFPPQLASTSVSAATSAPSSRCLMHAPFRWSSLSQHRVRHGVVARGFMIRFPTPWPRGLLGLAARAQLGAQRVVAETPGAEPAPRRHIGRAGQITDEQNPFPSAFLGWVWDRDSREQRLRVRVLRRAV